VEVVLQLDIIVVEMVLMVEVEVAELVLMVVLGLRHQGVQLLIQIFLQVFMDMQEEQVMEMELLGVNGQVEEVVVLVEQVEM